jgi:hypothetical protein
VRPTIYSAFLAGRTSDNVIRADPIPARGVVAPWHPTGFGLGSRLLDPFLFSVPGFAWERTGARLGLAAGPK